MGDIEKKARLSGEQTRGSEPATILPTVNVSTEKPEPPKSALHPAFYVVYNLPPFAAGSHWLITAGQNMDWV